MKRNKETKMIDRTYENVKVVCCDKCNGEGKDIERIVIGNREMPRCKKCGEIIY
jgi:hypothetical protein